MSNSIGGVVDWAHEMCRTTHPSKTSLVGPD